MAVMLSRGRSCQFGRTSAPIIPQAVKTVRAPKTGGSAALSDHGRGPFRRAKRT
jgi:hypothetical protein